MPTSEFANIPAIMNEVYRLKPAGVIELGIGVGKYGMLCRELLDGTEGRVKPETWRTAICGVEAFKDYDNPTWGMYDKVVIADFVNYYDKVEGWPLVLMIDSLEHVEEAAGRVILRYLVEHNQNVIVSVPLGSCPQDGVFGNPFEKHRASYFGGEFDAYRHRVLHRGVCLVVSIQGVSNGG